MRYLYLAAALRLSTARLGLASLSLLPALGAYAQAPTITGISPTSGLPGTVVTITGTNLSGVTKAYFNSAPVEVLTVVSATQVRAVFPLTASTGFVSLQIGTGFVRSAQRFVRGVDWAGARRFSPDSAASFRHLVRDSSGTGGLYAIGRTYAGANLGNNVVVADTPVGRLGLSVCYDLRFPELYTALREAGAELISAPSAFTAVTGAAHWEILLRARAIETQCYILAAAQGGIHPGPRETFGHAAIIDPWGRVLAEQAQGEAVLLAERDSVEQASIRARMPVSNHRRFFSQAAVRPANTPE